MANEERVEDLLAAQTEILQSGSGGALAMPVTSPSSASPSTMSTGSASSSQQEAYETMPPEAATGTCADDPTCQPVRLALEWLSTRSALIFISTLLFSTGSLGFLCTATNHYIRSQWERFS